jgi:hypothetical protein
MATIEKGRSPCPRSRPVRRLVQLLCIQRGHLSLAQSADTRFRQRVRAFRCMHQQVIELKHNAEPEQLPARVALRGTGLQCCVRKCCTLLQSLIVSFCIEEASITNKHEDLLESTSPSLDTTHQQELETQSTSRRATCTVPVCHKSRRDLVSRALRPPGPLEPPQWSDRDLHTRRGPPCFSPNHTTITSVECDSSLQACPIL